MTYTLNTLEEISDVERKEKNTSQERIKLEKEKV
jgi:hypothetical protein